MDIVVNGLELLKDMEKLMRKIKKKLKIAQDRQNSMQIKVDNLNNSRLGSMYF